MSASFAPGGSVDHLGIERHPIIVGIAGRRQFDRDDAKRDAALFATFAERFAALVQYLDDILVLTPKVLICGGAEGVDLHTAQIVLARREDGSPRHPGWSVILMLPFDEGLFVRTFANETTTTQVIQALKQDDRVSVQTLARLRETDFDDTRVGEPIPPPVGDELLDPTAAGKVRGYHYEQLALWLARYATVFVAATLETEVATVPEEREAGKTGGGRAGGTARSIAFRRTANGDKLAQDVIRHSIEIVTPSALDEPDAGHVLLIDPTVTPGTDKHHPPVAVLRPLQLLARDPQIRRAGLGPEQLKRRIYDAPCMDPVDPESEEEDKLSRRWSGALVLASAFERLHVRQLPIVMQVWLAALKLLLSASPAFTGFTRERFRRYQSYAPFATLSPTTSPPAYLARIRSGALAKQQVSAQRRHRLALRMMILAFLASVLCYEVYTEIRPEDHELLLTYVFLVFAIGAVVWMVGTLELQRRYEDFRGVREILRVQIAWWYAGLETTADRVHLRTIDSDLRLVREAAATMTLWAKLRCGAFPSGSAISNAWTDVQKVRDWIDVQVAYFRDNASKQQAYKELADEAFATVLTASLVALFVAALLLILDRESSPTNALPAWLSLAVLPVLLAAFVAACRPLLSHVSWALLNPWWRDTASTSAGTSVNRVRPTPAALGLLAVESGAVLGLLGIMAECAIGLAYGGARRPAESLTPTMAAMPSLLLILCTACCAIVPIVRLADAKLLEPVESTRSGTISRGVLLAALALDVVIVMSPAVVGLMPTTEANELHAIRALVLTVSVFLLAVAGMARFYTEQRNHSAQAAQYGDMGRAFRRAQDRLGLEPQNELRGDALRIVREMGELALDEDEAWLKAHRDRPTEPIAGA